MSRQHARFSPSKLGAKERCARFDYAQPDQGKANEAADEGELMHKAYETQDLSILETDEQIAQVTKCLQFADSLRHGVAKLIEHREIRMVIPDVTYGYSDHVIIDEEAKVAHVIDAKFGRKGADAADTNVQILCYAGALLFGTMNLPGIAQGMDIPVEGYLDSEGNPVRPVKVIGHIVSPRLESVTSVEYTIDDKERMLGRLEQILANAADPFYPPSPDPDLCTQCQWRASCPAVNALAIRTAEGLETHLPSVVDPAKIAMASPEDKARVYALAQILEAWGEAARKVVTEAAILRGETIPNYQVVKRAGTTKIDGTAEATAMMEGLVPPEVIVEASTISLSKLSDSFAKHSGKTKVAAREELEAVLAPVLERGPEVRYLQRKRGVSEKDILSQVPQLKVGDGTPNPET